MNVAWCFIAVDIQSIALLVELTRAKLLVINLS
ncbi:hypothetical protein SAMN04489724_1862 [Algoriphagus locisalis]|uniref:Uncharacterized protein n=1 Tax=Algoriphagus locisalis TaxID=305507 RepID=A0A1I7AD10_9BACT|nr:hypothetical protein SAMN04489724_1862 [Algoriphagus locisalis]